MAGGYEANVVIAERVGLAEGQDVLETLARQTRLHQARGGRAEDDFAMRRDMVRMSVTDENFFRSGPRPMGIKPQIQLRQNNAPGLSLRR